MVMAYAVHSMFCVIPVSCHSSLALANTMSVIKYLEPCREKDINRRSVFAANEVGLGREGIAAICEALNMPPPVAPTAWAAHEDELYKQNLVVINEELEKNRCELKELFQRDSSNLIIVISQLQVAR